MMASRNNLPIRHQHRAHGRIWTRSAKTFLRLRESGTHERFRRWLLDPSAGEYRLKVSRGNGTGGNGRETMSLRRRSRNG